MHWTDIYDIAVALADNHPDVDIERISFVDLHQKVCSLEGFDDDPARSNEKILEAIQAAWLEEVL